MRNEKEIIAIRKKTIKVLKSLSKEDFINSIISDLNKVSLLTRVLTNGLMSQIMEDEPKLFLQMHDLFQELIDNNQMPHQLRIRLPHLSIENILRLIDLKKETASNKEKEQLREVLRVCILFNSQPQIDLLSSFLLQAPSWVVESFFAHLNGFIADETFNIGAWRNIFMSMITDNRFLQCAALQNRTDIFTGLKTIGIDLNTAELHTGSVLIEGQREEVKKRGLSAIHVLAGNASIVTATFLLQHGADINARDDYNRTPLWFLFSKIKSTHLNLGGSAKYSKKLHSNREFDYHRENLEEHTFCDKERSKESERRYLISKIEKAIFALENGADLSFSDAELSDIVELFKSIFIATDQSRSKYPTAASANIQYLCGLVIEKINTPKEAVLYFRSAATNGNSRAAIKLAEYFLSIHKEEDALAWYQQAIHHSQGPKLTLLAVMGLDNMIKVAHGLGLRKTEIAIKQEKDAKKEKVSAENPTRLETELQSLQKSHRIIMNALMMIEFSQETPLSIESTLLLAHTLVDYDPSSQHCQQALKLACIAYNWALSSNKELALQGEFAARQRSNLRRKLNLEKGLVAHEEPHTHQELTNFRRELTARDALPSAPEESKTLEDSSEHKKLPLPLGPSSILSQEIQQAQQDINHFMMLMLAELSEQERGHYNGVKFMPEPLKCGIAHYKRLCLELTRLNLASDNKERAQHWYTTTCILGYSETTGLVENPIKAIDEELHNIVSIVPNLNEEMKATGGTLRRPPTGYSIYGGSSSSSSSSTSTSSSLPPSHQQQQPQKAQPKKEDPLVKNLNKLKNELSKYINKRESKKKDYYNHGLFARFTYSKNEKIQLAEEIISCIDTKIKLIGKEREDKENKQKEEVKQDEMNGNSSSASLVNGGTDTRISNFPPSADNGSVDTGNMKSQSSGSERLTKRDMEMLTQRNALRASDLAEIFFKHTKQFDILFEHDSCYQEFFELPLDLQFYAKLI